MYNFQYVEECFTQFYFQIFILKVCLVSKAFPYLLRLPHGFLSIFIILYIFETTFFLCVALADLKLYIFFETAFSCVALADLKLLM